MTPSQSDHGEQPTCGHPTTTTGDPCQRPVSGPGDRCYLHTADGGVPDDHGAPEGNKNAATSGLHLSVKRRLEWFRELGDEWVELFEDYYVEFHAKAENRTEAARIASLAVVMDHLESRLVADGPTYQTTTDDGTVIELPRSGMLEEYFSANRELRLLKRDEGVSGNKTDSSDPHSGANALWEDADNGRR